MPSNALYTVFFIRFYPKIYTVFVTGFISGSMRNLFLVGLYNYFYLVFYPVICEIFSVPSNALHGFLSDSIRKLIWYLCLALYPVLSET